MARKKLQGQVAIITGGSRGLGVGIAERFIQAGATVVLTARSTEQLEAQATRLRSRGGRVLAITADVSDGDQVQAVVDQAVDQFQHVDILVNNAGVVWPVEEVIDSDPEEWAYNIHVNLIGPFYMAYSVLPVMMEQGYGRIVNVSSGLGRTPVAGLSAYGAAKAGLDQFTRILALEVAKTKITVNSLHPGIVDTDMQADLRSVDTSESAVDLTMFHEFYETNQLASPYMAARLVYWLVGPWNRARSGEIFSFRDEAWLAQVDEDLREDE
ncbi:MAG: SDR family oxidoreductase [Caldilineaceae bacterium]